jgi:hypothetical protein
VKGEKTEEELTMVTEKRKIGTIAGGQRGKRLKGGGGRLRALIHGCSPVL